ncbi:hypothetical protein Pint_27467 [Pistacia integerrima]|uniref:Uncharacterized protein n=1 Tax=Pistacia integerrima TaxID=434235 RepID=A0ACC0YRZ1_9ROSI|nr:hypothetical protein Pint_27467 [Pistacia integerrima]
MVLKASQLCRPAALIKEDPQIPLFEIAYRKASTNVFCLGVYMSRVLGCPSLAWLLQCQAQARARHREGELASLSSAEARIDSDISRCWWVPSNRALQATASTVSVLWFFGRVLWVLLVVSEVSSRLGRAGTVGLGKAMDVLDTLGSSMTNLNPQSGFLSGVGTKSNELTILAFEVANTIVKGSNLMQSLSKSSIRELKEVVLLSKGVQNLVSKDMDELLNIVAADKREELKIFTGEVVRFGNRTKDPQWHNLNRYFEKISRELIPQTQLQEEAELVMEQLMTLVQNTAELYHELQVLDRFEQDYQRKRQEEDNSGGTQKGDNFAIWGAELKSQRKLVKSLKKKSLWSINLEEVMEKLVDIVHFLLLEMHIAFGSTDADHSPFKGSISIHQRLGPAGLALHYANIVMQIDTLVSYSSHLFGMFFYWLFC